MSSYFSYRANCEFCGRQHTDNCDFEFPQECKNLRDMIRRGDTRNLVIVVQWRDNPPANLSIVQTPIVKSMNEDKNSIINPSTDSKITLYDCLNNFMVEETLSGNDKWYCGKCKDHVVATKKMEIYKIPECLIIHFKRFSHTRNSLFGSKKLQDKIDFPIESLNMSNYVLTSNGKKIIYDLYAVSNHFGSLHGGHYTAFAKNPIY